MEDMSRRSALALGLAVATATPTMMNQTNTANAANSAASEGPWEAAAFAKLRELDPAWADTANAMVTSPWTRGVLTRKEVELISLAVNVSCTNLNEEGTRRHIRGALGEGATPDEILLVIKMGTVTSIHSCNLGAPILQEEAKAAGVEPANPTTAAATPAIDKMKAIGQWNEVWNAFFELDPAWTELMMANGAGLYREGLVTPKLYELIAIAIDASYTHMYAPSTRRHVKLALSLGATIEEIMAALEICVSQGAQSCNLALPILAEEMAAAGKP